MKAKKELDAIALTDVINGILEDIQLDHDCSKPYVRHLLANALMRNLVANKCTE